MKFIICASIIYFSITTIFAADGLHFAGNDLHIRSGGGVTNFVITNNGQFGIGVPTTPTAPTELFDIVSSGASLDSGHYSYMGASPTSTSHLQFKRSRGTQAAPTILQNGDKVFLYPGSFSFLRGFFSFMAFPSI